MACLGRVRVIAGLTCKEAIHDSCYPPLRRPPSPRPAPAVRPGTGPALRRPSANASSSPCSPCGSSSPRPSTPTTPAAPPLPPSLVVFRERQGDGSWKHDYLLTNGPLGTTREEFALVFKPEHRVEECLQRAKGEAGLADYEVRTWRGWYHHWALALVATLFLTVEAGRGKKMDPDVDGAAVAEAGRWDVGAALGDGTFGVHESHREPALTPD